MAQAHKFEDGMQPAPASAASEPGYDAGLSNRDLAPVEPAQRRWGVYNYFALWVGMSVCIPTYMLASGLIAGGMNWWEALVTILLGNLIVLVPMLLNAHAGTKYGIPFPVLVRASFGVRGANLPALLRALVACGWFGIQTWIGGQAIHTMLGVVWPGVAQSQLWSWGCFFAFWVCNLYVVWKGLDTIRFLEGISAPFMLAVGLLLLWWIVRLAGGFGPVFEAPSKFHTTGEFWAFFVPSLTGMVGFWATVALNIPDFTRYAKSQRAQVWGQALGLPTTMTLFAFIGVAVTSASTLIFGAPVWDPVVLLGRLNRPVVAIIALIALLVATLSTNVAANVVSPSNDFSNLNPRRISFRTGGMITGIAGVLMMPWKLLSDANAYIFGWLVGYSSLLGPIAGIMITDYFLLRGRRLSIESLYSREGAYAYTNGINWTAVASLGAGVATALLGLALPPLRWLYNYAWFVGLIVSGGCYWISMRGRVRVNVP